MRRLVFFAYFLCLSFWGVAQGIEIESRADEERSLGRRTDYEYVFYRPSAQYRLKDTNLYREKGVQAIELFDAGKKLVFKVIFDRQGNIVHLSSVGQSGLVMISTDMFPAREKSLTVVRYYNSDELLRVDTTLLEQITEYRRNKSPLKYNKETFRSYKRGRYLTERNDYYKMLLTEGSWIQDFRIAALPPVNGWPRRIDGNAGRPFRWPETAGSRLLLHGRVDQDKIYLTQQTKVYHTVSGASAIEEQRILGRRSMQYFKEGENPAVSGIIVFRNSNWCGYSRQYFNSGPIRLPPYTTETSMTGGKGLTDSIVQITYIQQADNAPCIRPLDTNNILYLRGYAGLPSETRTLYTFQYTYFTD